MRYYETNLYEHSKLITRILLTGLCLQSCTNANIPTSGVQKEQVPNRQKVDKSIAIKPKEEDCPSLRKRKRVREIDVKSEGFLAQNLPADEDEHLFLSNRKSGKQLSRESLISSGQLYEKQQCKYETNTMNIEGKNNPIEYGPATLMPPLKKTK